MGRCQQVEEPYEVKKTRTKRVPTTEFKEVEEWQDVVVEEDELVDKTGFRVDEVEDTKLVEVEEEEVYELVPRPVKTNVRGAVYVYYAALRVCDVWLVDTLRV